MGKMPSVDGPNCVFPGTSNRHLATQIVSTAEIQRPQRLLFRHRLIVFIFDSDVFRYEVLLLSASN